MAALLVPMTGAVAQVPSLGDVEPGNVSPHGGYSSATDFCLQCHDVHQETVINEYALLIRSSINAVCQTCHGLSPVLPDDGYYVIDPAGVQSGTTSSKPVYTNSGSQHTPGATDYDGLFMMRYDGRTTDSAIAGGGLTCANCHTPHGDFGQMVNNWTLDDEGAFVRISRTTYGLLDWDGTDMAWRFCPANSDGTPVADAVVIGDGVCANGVYATFEDAKGAAAYAYGYKLLSAGPNHQYATGITADWANLFEPYNDTDGWCTTCHYNKLDEEGVHNNHPHCDRCHGNPETLPAGATADFPHSSVNPTLLIDVPDALCVNCHPHSPGRLP